MFHMTVPSMHTISAIVSYSKLDVGSAMVLVHRHIISVAATLFSIYRQTSAAAAAAAFQHGQHHLGTRHQYYRHLPVQHKKISAVYSATVTATATATARDVVTCATARQLSPTALRARAQQGADDTTGYHHHHHKEEETDSESNINWMWSTGAADRAAPMTRSRAMASMLSSSLLMIASGAGLLGSPGAVTAATTALGTAENSAVATLVEKDSAATVIAAVPAAEEAVPQYVLGRDEFGVLFGDGPIGVKLGENPLKASGVCRVFVTEVIEKSQAIREPRIHAGLGVSAVAGTPAALLEPKGVAELIRVSKRPIEIVFRDPELLARRLQAEADKMNQEMRRKRQAAAVEDITVPPSSDGSPGELKVTQVGSKPKVCNTRSKAGDLIEFRYSARLASDLSVEFDSSDRRGTGTPYAIVLGNGDVVKGLDLSLFDMCIGERRRIEIPARLAYGKKGSKIFGIPPEDGTGSGSIVYGVELVSINFRSDASDKRDNFYTDDPCDAAAIAAGNASGLCQERPTPAAKR